MAFEIREPMEEELLPGDRPRCFHPTHPGDVLDGRFKTIAKLGFGAGSTVWLAENLKLEMMYSKLISHAKPSHEGLSFIRTPIDEFRLKGPEGKTSKNHYGLAVNPNPLDIKDDNIMVTTENDTVLADFVSYQTNNPQPRHIRSDGRVTYLSQGDFGSLRGSRLLPELADFNLSYPGLDKTLGHLSAIQSHRFRAPEALLGCPWSYSADIWNLGLLMWNPLEDTSLFGRPAGEDGEYDAHVHLAQMVSLLGDPPGELIKRERIYREHQLKRPITNSYGRVCKTMNEFWGGPFFGDDDIVMEIKPGSVEDLIKDGLFIREPSSASPFLHQMLQALDYLATQSIVHRDVKPEKILYSYAVDGGYLYQLADFGLANMVADGSNVCWVEDIYGA
ncbi:hypothetical protein IL306_007717 [Fusarium sp. DS 682]|nr:hypothetical protein IL306_007717 [Fusarium sp. DS 682]